MIDQKDTMLGQIQELDVQIRVLDIALGGYSPGYDEARAKKRNRDVHARNGNSDNAEEAWEDETMSSSRARSCRTWCSSL